MLSGNVNPAELDRGRDSFAGYNIMAVALRLPASTLRGLKPGAPTVLGVNAITSRKNERIVKGDKVGSGAYQQLDRIGVPGVNVAFLPYNMKNAYNGGTTIDDSKGKFFSAIAGTLTALGTNAQNIGTLASVTGLPPAFPIPKGGALGTGDFLRLQTDKAVKPNPAMGGSTAGGGSDASNGFPNGRRLRDDVIDTVLFLVTNGVITAGDHVNASEVPPTDTFPFVAPPTQPFINGVTDDQTRN